MPVKGQTLSIESINKMKESKLSRLLSKYNWVLAEPYLDADIKNGSVKRTNQYITFREFKNNIEDGLSINDMAQTGISKKILQFFSNFCQGKINLTKEQFEYNYEKGMSLDEICKEFSVTREDLTYLRQLYGIKRRGATYINRKKTEEPLSQRQREIIYGSLMGDAKRNDKRHGSSVGFGHSDKQESYLRWKYIELENLASKGSLKKYSQYDKRFDKTYVSWRFYTTANTEIEEIISQFYKEDKQITREVLDNLTELSVAVWAMDDGYIDKSNYILCTDSFSKESCDLIIEWFKERWNIDCHYRSARGRIIVKFHSVHSFFDLIRPHIIPSMRYKIGEK
ncbi:MAG: hypothetical protein ACTSSP_01065 [Candidatus Asgardarchaeia archaeon]